MVIHLGFAGIRAGKAYKSFSLMDGHVVPPEIFLIEPWYLNFFNNMATVQFDHRLGAWLLALALFVLTAKITLGIYTLLLSVPVALGAAHQGGSMRMFGALLCLNHELRVGTTVKSNDQTRRIREPELFTPTTTDRSAV